MRIRIVFVFFFFCRHEREQTKVPGRVQGREKSNLFMARAICERGEDGLQGRELRFTVREAEAEQSKGRP